MASHTAAPRHLPNQSHVQKANQAVGHEPRQESVASSETSKKQFRDSADRPRRVVSTPNLVKHQVQTEQLAYGNSEIMADSGVQQPLNMDMSPMSRQGQFKKALKRSHSSTSISEGEKLANDNDDTSDLFLQFVHKMSRDYYTRHAEATAAAQSAEQMLYQQNQYVYHQQQQMSHYDAQRQYGQQPQQFAPDLQHLGDVDESRDITTRIDTQQPEDDRVFKLIKLEASGSVASLSSDSTSNESVYESPVPQAQHASASSSLTSSCATSPVGLEMDCEEEVSNQYTLPRPVIGDALNSGPLDEKTRRFKTFNDRDYVHTAETIRAYESDALLNRETSDEPDEYNFKDAAGIGAYEQPQFYRMEHAM
jgi:hypothetical protein